MANPNRRNGRSESQAVGAPKWVVFVGGLATGVIATVVTGALLWPRTLAPAADGDHAAATATEAAKPNDRIHYEYDDMLRTSEVPVEAPASTETTTPADAAPARVVLQAGSFRNRDEAENMRAQLLLLGIGPSSTREALVKGGEVWHRVLVGPFANQAALHAAQGKLRQQNIEALSIAAPADMRVEAPAQPSVPRTDAARPPFTQTTVTQSAVTPTAVARPDIARTERARAKTDGLTAPSQPTGAATPSSSPNSASATRQASAPKPIPRPSLPAATQPARELPASELPVREQPAREQPPKPLPVEAASAGAVINHSVSNCTTRNAAGAYALIGETRSEIAVVGVA